MCLSASCIENATYHAGLHVRFASHLRTSRFCCHGFAKELFPAGFLIFLALRLHPSCTYIVSFMWTVIVMRHVLKSFVPKSHVHCDMFDRWLRETWPERGTVTEWCVFMLTWTNLTAGSSERWPHRCTPYCRCAHPAVRGTFELCVQPFLVGFVGMHTAHSSSLHSRDHR